MRIAFIPAKGTSLGLPNKNLLRVGSETLLERALNLVIKDESFSKIVVSTESEEIASAVKLFLQSYQIPFEDSSQSTSICQLNEKVEIHFRSSRTSDNFTKTVDVVLEYLELAGLKTGSLLLLQPTSPFRRNEEIMSIFQIHAKHPGKSIFSAKIIDSPHPNKSFLLNLASDEQYLLDKLPTGLSVPRQKLPRWACPDGAYYLTPIELIIKLKTLVTEPSALFLRDGLSTLNIDSPIDYEFADYLVKQGRMS